jgi:hypothetical protein
MNQPAIKASFLFQNLRECDLLKENSPWLLVFPYHFHLPRVFVRHIMHQRYARANKAVTFREARSPLRSPKRGGKGEVIPIRRIGLNPFRFEFRVVFDSCPRFYCFWFHLAKYKYACAVWMNVQYLLIHFMHMHTQIHPGWQEWQMSCWESFRIEYCIYVQHKSPVCGKDPKAVRLWGPVYALGWLQLSQNSISSTVRSGDNTCNYKGLLLILLWRMTFISSRWGNAR